MKRYRCKVPLLVERYDDEGYRAVGQMVTVPAGTVMEISDKLQLAAPPSVRLESKDGLWVEISPQTLKKHFEEVKQ